MPIQVENLREGFTEAAAVIRNTIQNTENLVEKKLAPALRNLSGAAELKIKQMVVKIVSESGIAP